MGIEPRALYTLGSCFANHPCLSPKFIISNIFLFSVTLSQFTIQKSLLTSCFVRVLGGSRWYTGKGLLGENPVKARLSKEATARTRGKRLQAPRLSSESTAARTDAPSVVPSGKDGLWHLGTACLIVDCRDLSHSPLPVLCVGALQGLAASQDSDLQCNCRGKDSGMSLHFVLGFPPTTGITTGVTQANALRGRWRDGGWGAGEARR